MSECLHREKRGIDKKVEGKTGLVRTIWCEDCGETLFSDITEPLATPPDPKDQRIAEMREAYEMQREATQTALSAGKDLLAERDQLHARVQELESQLLQMAGTQAAGLAREEKLFNDLDAARAECERLAAEHRRCMERYGNAKRLAAEYRAEAERLEAGAARMREALNRLLPARDIPGFACWGCDMGGAGYSSQGEGHHDDDCPVRLARQALAETDAGDRGRDGDG